MGLTPKDRITIHLVHKGISVSKLGSIIFFFCKTFGSAFQEYYWLILAYLVYKV